MSRRIATIAVGGMLILAILTVIDVGLRYLFNAPLHGLDEATQLLMAVIVAATFPVVMMQRGHITIDLLQGALGERYAKLGEAIGAALMLLFIALLAWRFGIYANRPAA